ncbi:hypothetical protein [Streptomyces sp. NPDC003480]
MDQTAEYPLGAGMCMVLPTGGGVRLRGATEGVTVRELPWRACVRLCAARHRIDLRPVVASFRSLVLGRRAEPRSGVRFQEVIVLLARARSLCFAS